MKLLRFMQNFDTDYLILMQSEKKQNRTDRFPLKYNEIDRSVTSFVQDFAHMAILCNTLVI